MASKSTPAGKQHRPESESVSSRSSPSTNESKKKKVSCAEDHAQTQGRPGSVATRNGTRRKTGPTVNGRTMNPEKEEQSIRGESAKGPGITKPKFRSVVPRGRDGVTLVRDSTSSPGSKTILIKGNGITDSDRDCPQDTHGPEQAEFGAHGQSEGPSVKKKTVKPDTKSAVVRKKSGRDSGMSKPSFRSVGCRGKGGTTPLHDRMSPRSMSTGNSLAADALKLNEENGTAGGARGCAQNGPEAKQTDLSKDRSTDPGVNKKAVKRKLKKSGARGGSGRGIGKTGPKLRNVVPRVKGGTIRVLAGSDSPTTPRCGPPASELDIDEKNKTEVATHIAPGHNPGGREPTNNEAQGSTESHQDYSLDRSTPGREWSKVGLRAGSNKGSRNSGSHVTVERRGNTHRHVAKIAVTGVEAHTGHMSNRGGSRSGPAARGAPNRGRGGRTRGLGRGGRNPTRTGRDVNHQGPRDSRSSDVERRIGPIDARTLQQLADADSRRTTKILHEYRILLRVFLDGKSISNVEIKLLIEVLGRACNDITNHRSQRLKDILQLLDETFFLDETLTQWIRIWPEESPSQEECDKTVIAIIDLLTCMLEHIPSTINSMGVLAIILESSLNELKKKDVQMSPEVESRLSAFGEERERRLQEIRRFPAQGGKGNSPPDDFRLLPILPTNDELKSNYRPFLRTNIVNGNYKDVHQYLDVHFRLLREDFVQPLREGIAEYTSELAKNGPNSRNRIQDFSLYRNVRAIEVNLRTDGLSYVLQFEVERHLRNVKWDISKRLSHGSLVCLSRDHFRTLLFGTVAERKPEDLQYGKIEVAFDDPDEANELLSFRFTMAESPAYFEAYCHVLRCLQSINQEIFPFAKYLVNTESGQVDPPKYMADKHPSTSNQYDIAENTEDGSNNDSSDDDISSSLLEIVDVGTKGRWSSAEMLELDDSQMVAFQSALQEEICLIQGPPGTGKTFVGLKIAKALLSNIGKWGGDGPMLVVCYTNHALDQFLEGILEFETNIARIGSRSKCAKLEKYNIKELRKTQHIHQYNIVRSGIGRNAEQIGRCKLLIDTVRNRLLKAEVLRCVMTEDQVETLEAGTRNPKKHDPILKWLNVLKESTQYRERKNGSLNDDSGTNAKPAQTFSKYEAGLLDDEDDFLSSVKPDEDEIVRTVTVFLPVYRRHWNPNGEGWQLVPDVSRLEQIDRFLKHQLSQQDMMSKEEAFGARSVWRMNVQQRWRLYRRWVVDYSEQMRRRRQELFSEYNRQVNTLKELRLKKDLLALKHRAVVGATTTGAARYNELIRSIGAPIIIIEEAAEILEAHVITSLTVNTQHLILIGDHQQLRPNPAVYKLCKDFKLDVSLFERLIKNNLPYHRLSLQHRMRPEISNLLRVHGDFYPELLDHEMVTTYKSIRGVEKDVFFVNHDITEESDEESRSRSNVHEASFLVSLLTYLLQQGYSSEQITILTAYRGQVRTLNEILKERKLEGVHVFPIDNFQGEENDIILFSFVRSNVEGSIGFLKVSNRVCVALSRAKMGLYCIGNFSLLSRQSDLWKAICSYLQKKELIGPRMKLFCRNHPERVLEAAESIDFKNSPEGGCKEPCTARLNCGHTCQRICHPEDSEHRTTHCYKPCETVMCDLGHICPKICYEECGYNCYVVVKKVLPCHHEQWEPCLKLSAEISCSHPCERKLPCGHQCNEICSEKCTRNCRKVVVMHFESCGHSSKMQCFRTGLASCPHPCKRQLSCGHQCKGICGQECTESCEEPVLKRFEPCGHSAELPCDQHECPAPCATLLKCRHTCQGTCGECQNGRYHLPCREVCKKILLCGHACQSICTRICPPCSKPCMVRCAHGRCPRRCGESCDPCKLPCTWKCRHAKCSKLCGEICEESPCNDNCPIPKKCKKRKQHKCIGICGERCPRLCRICNKDEVAKALSGVGDKRNSRFIQLEDCSHIVEVRTMDGLMSGSKEERSILKPPECPRCKTTITNASHRYDKMMGVLRDDMDKVNKRVAPDGERAKMTEERLRKGISKAKGTIQMTNTRHHIFANSKKSFRIRPDNRNWTEFMVKLDIELGKPRRSVSDLSRIDILIEMYHKMEDLEKIIADESKDIPLKLISSTEQFDLLQNNREFLEGQLKRLPNISDQELDDWHREYRRCRHTVSLLHIVGLFTKAGMEIDEYGAEKNLFDEIDQLLTDCSLFTDGKDSRVGYLLNKMKSVNPLLSNVSVADEERKMLFKSAGFSRGEWYKCQNGHVYALADCRGSRNRCPECGT